MEMHVFHISNILTDTNRNDSVERTLSALFLWCVLG